MTFKPFLTAEAISSLQQKEALGLRRGAHRRHLFHRGRGRNHEHRFRPFQAALYVQRGKHTGQGA